MAERKKWQDLTITDDYMFKLVMKHQHICKHLIEVILNIKVREIKYIENEKSFKNTYDSKGIRLDVYVEDKDNSRFLLEMQVKDYGAEEIAKRSRFYQITLDFDFLNAGHKYRELGDAYVIFFCPFKLFGGKQRMYTFENTCREDKSITLGDGTAKVFLSSVGEPTDDLNPDVAAFLGYMNGYLEDNKFVKDIDEEIRHMKTDGKEEMSYMTYLMKLDEERENERADIIANMLKEHTSLEFIMKVCNTSMDFIKEVARQRGLALDY